MNVSFEMEKSMNKGIKSIETCAESNEVVLANKYSLQVHEF